MYERIIVPLDGSPVSSEALPSAERLARLFDARMHLVRVVVISQPRWFGRFGLDVAPLTVEQALEDSAKSATAELEASAKRISSGGINVDFEVRRGNAARELVTLGQPGDIIVMTSHGRTGLSRWLIGSVAEA